MFKILLVLLLITTPSWATQWRAGTGEQTLLGTSAAALIGTNSFNSIVKPLDSLLSTYNQQYLSYASSSTITVSVGSVTVSNSQGTIRLMLQNTLASTLTWGNLDTGSQQASTTYYVYAIAATNSATAATYLISASNTSPSGATYYLQIGSFVTDSNTNITGLINNYGSTFYIGTSTSKSENVVYQALTDGFLNAMQSSCFSGNNTTRGIAIYSDSSSTPVTIRSFCGTSSTTTCIACNSSWFVRKGDFYEETNSTGTAANINFIPTSK